jgi:hypothetical protein
MGNAVQGRGIDRDHYEKQWANHEARLKLSPEDKMLWDAARHTFRPYVYFDKVLVVWSVIKGEPQIKEVFKIEGLETSFQDGIWLRLQAQIAKRTVTLSHTPRRMLPDLDIIAWVPYFNELRYASGDWEDLDSRKNLRLHACFKMRAQYPGTTLNEGQDYLSELHVFRAQFPQYAAVRF